MMVYMQPPLTPPKSAVVLFNGKDLGNWHTRKGERAGWEVSKGVMTVVRGTGDIVTEQKFTDFMLHLEWMEPDMPEAKGQAKGNSGVYLQGRYEIQVLDSYGIEILHVVDLDGAGMHQPVGRIDRQATAGAGPLVDQR